MEAQEAKAKISKGKKIKFILSTVLFLAAVLILISEAVLYFIHYPSTYNRMQDFDFEQAKWWTCDSASGPRYVANQMGGIDSNNYKSEMWYYKRLNIVNSQGYHDKDEFTEIPASSDSLRVLFAGDSFTWGASADIDSSYVEVFTSDIKKVYPSVVWNTGIPATGTNHALFTTKKFLPVQKSNFVVLGFFTGNDFQDNLLPFDKLIFNKGNGCYNLYDYDKDFKPFPITKNEACRKASGSLPSDDLNVVQKILNHSRVYTFFGDMKDKLVNRLSGTKEKVHEQSYKMTEQYLKELNDYVKANGAELVVYIIPTVDDIKQKTTQYQDVVKILSAASIKYIDNTSLFTVDDYMKTGGGHWKNRGHVAAGHTLSKYVLDYIKQKGVTSFKKN